MGEELTKTFNVKFTIPKSWDSLEVLNTMIQDFYANNSESYPKGEIKAEINGPPAEILFADNPQFIKFECFVPIRTLPESNPSKCKIKILPSSKMLLFNYYGEMKQLKFVYRDISKILEEKNLLQTGPSREYYLTDPTADVGESRYMTRVFMPVKEK